VNELRGQRRQIKGASLKRKGAVPSGKGKESTEGYISIGWGRIMNKGGSRPIVIPRGDTFSTATAKKFFR